MFRGTIYFNRSPSTNHPNKITKCSIFYTNWKFLTLSAKSWFSLLFSILLPLLICDLSIYFFQFLIPPSYASNIVEIIQQPTEATTSQEKTIFEYPGTTPEPTTLSETPPTPFPSPTIPPILNSIPDLPPNTPQAIHKPLESYKKLTTQFSRFHPAIDLSAKPGTTVFAILPGKVSHSGWSNDGFGNSVVIETSNGSWTRYAHLSHTLVVIGNTVSPGQVIGTVGCTGNCSGPHLHLQVFQNGEFINPLTFLQ